MSIKKIDFSALSAWGAAGTPFFALVDFDGNVFGEKLEKKQLAVDASFLEGRIDLGVGDVHFRFCSAPQSHDAGGPFMQGTPAMEILSLPSRKAVTHAIKSIQDQIGAGYSYLVNYCSQTEVELHHSVAAIYRAVRAPFRVWFENRFLCFSPEAFVSVVDNRICTTPMKGTGYDAARLLSDAKEKAEHATVVDLLRNDLGSVAREVRLGRYRFLTAIAQSDARVLYQTSTEIYGRLTADWPSRVGEWLSLLLPAGSVTGAPKKKTVELIRAHESQARGFFTGIAALFDGRNFYSCVLIRFIDLAKRPYVFRSGAGITVDSDADAEYDEIVSKVYIPL